MRLRQVATRLLFIGLALITLPGTLWADNFDQVLVQEHAPRIYSLLDKAGHKAVGVLNFSLIRESIDASPSFQSAPITRVLPARLQNALLLFSATKFGNELKILVDPSSVAGEKGITSYRTAQERTRLFDLTYPVYSLSTQAASFKPDAFIIGEISLSADKTKTKVALKIIDGRLGDQPRSLYDFTVATDLSILAESGVSFSLRSRDVKNGAKSRSNMADLGDRVVTSDKLPASTTRKTDVSPGTDQASETLTSSWIDFQVMYEGVPQQVMRDSFDKAKYVVKAVTPGQRITFKLKNISDEKIGVALLVNKKNMLYGEDIETRDPRRLSKFILTPGLEQTINGMMDVEGSGSQANVVRELRGLSQQETVAAAKELGQSNFCGFITLYVFHEGNENVFLSSTGDNANPTKPTSSPAPLAATSPFGSSNGLRNPSNRLAWVGAGSLENLFKESDEVAKARDVLIGVRGPTEKVETKEDRIKNPVYAEAIHIRYWNLPKSDFPIIIGR